MKPLLILLLVEKIIQHILVTAAFAVNWHDIRATVAVNPDGLMVGGGVVAVLFAVSLWAVLTQRKWGLWLVMALALVDLVGEFVAQGTLGIVINVSFLVAVVLLVLAILIRRRSQERGAS